MLKNNILGFIGHLIILLLTFLFLSLVQLSEKAAPILYGTFAGKGLLISFILLLYYFFGKLLNKQESITSILASGGLIFVVAIFCIVIAWAGLGSGMENSSLGSSMWRFPLDLFLLPEFFIAILLHLPKNGINAIFLAMMPGIVYVASLLSSRRKFNKRKKLRQKRNRRREVV